MRRRCCFDRSLLFACGCGELKFLGQCHDPAFERNVQQLAAPGACSHEALKSVVHATGINHYRLGYGMAHDHTGMKLFDTTGNAAALMRKYGMKRLVVSTAELPAIEPALRQFAYRIVGGTCTCTCTYTDIASDESGNARVFTQALCPAGLGWALSCRTTAPSRGLNVIVTL